MRFATISRALRALLGNCRDAQTSSNAQNIACVASGLNTGSAIRKRWTSFIRASPEYANNGREGDSFLVSRCSASLRHANREL